jgi:hypothetical protein
MLTKRWKKRILHCMACGETLSSTGKRKEALAP